MTNKKPSSGNEPPQQRPPSPPRARVVVGSVKFIGNPWALVAIAALGVVALLIVTAWLTPHDLVSILETF